MYRVQHYREIEDGKGENVLSGNRTRDLALHEASDTSGFVFSGISSALVQ